MIARNALKIKIGRMKTRLTRRALLFLSVFLAGVMSLGVSPARAQVLEGVQLEALREQAIAIVKRAAASDDAALRMNAIEASQAVPGLAGELVGKLMLDDVAPVRFAALMTVGKLKLGEHATRAVDLSVDPDHSVRAAAIYAGVMNGEKLDVSPLAAYAMSSDPSVRGNAALILGEMGDPSAIALLQEAARRPYPRQVTTIRREIVRVQLAEAEVKLTDRSQGLTAREDDDVMSPIRAAVYSQSDEIRVLAVSMLGPLEDKRMIPMLVKMLETPPAELQLAAARSLLLMDVEDGLPILIRALSSAYPAVRAQAAYSLGSSEDPTSLVLLGETMRDQEAMVRLSAAAGLLKRVPTVEAAHRLAQK